MGRRLHQGSIILSAFPVRPEDLSAAWLGEKLGCDVSDFRVERLGEGGGLLGLVTRVHLESDTGPATVIAKFPTEAEDNRFVATTYDMYGREYRFYTQVAPNVPIRAPHCYHAEFNPENSDFVLLIEELMGYDLGDQVVGCSLSEAHAIVKDLAALHRSTWQPSDDIEINQHDMPYQREGMIGGYGVGWPGVLANFSDVLHAELEQSEIDLLATVPEHVNSLLDKIHEGPLVIAHGDVRLDNVFFSNEGNALVDYQAVCKAAPEHDLAYFVTQSLSDDVRHAEDWVAVYHQHLTNEGIDYDLETSRERFRYLALYFVCYAVIIAGTLDQANERGRKLAETLLAYSLRSIKELNALELIK
ncbi:MAG: phosphotransferase [Pseudomonadales bacterium]|nr:phosphotransferase [Pseudomonadales bacterium]